MMTILYPLYGNLYVNMTNRCPCACTFCLRNNGDELNGSGNLWLDREPDVSEVKAAFDQFPPDRYEDIVFCGYGEPTERLEDLLEVVAFAKEKFQKNPREHKRIGEPHSRQRCHTDVWRDRRCYFDQFEYAGSGRISPSDEKQVWNRVF